MEKSRITNFIHDHWGNKSDPKKAIHKSLEYAAKERAGLGGYVFTITQNNPAKKMFEEFGFLNPYLEMRYKQKTRRSSTS